MKGGKKRSSASISDDGTHTVHPPPLPPPIPPQEVAEATLSAEHQQQQKQQSVKATVSADEKEEESQYPDDEDEEDDEEEEEYNEDEEENGEHLVAEGGDDNGDGERPKLAEGYYEIEAVRKKRVRKGQVQYLIKWRGWPETANTWEPLENLMSVSDVVDAFEDSIRAGKHRGTRRRKRKYGSTHNQTKKKQQQRSPAASTYNVPAVRVRIMDEPLPFPSLNDSNNMHNVEISVGIVNDSETSKQVNANGMWPSFSRAEEKKENNELNMNLRERRGPKVANDKLDKGSTHSQKDRVTGWDGLSNGLPKSDGVEVGQSSRCTGAKRRKSGSVKRFKQDSASSVTNDVQSLALTNFSAPSAVDGQGSHNLEYTGNDFSSNNNFNDSRSICMITEIIKPISYSASITNNLQDVSVTFMAKRADGKEVMVDNKFLKAKNPLLLISFYEQHLRYSVM